MELFPPIPYAGWADTLATMHRFAQIVGKVRLAASPRRNHWWNVPFHLTGRGITTRPMGLETTFAIDFDLVGHRLRVDVLDGRSVSFPLVGRSVAAFHADVVAALAGLGIAVDISDARPFDLPDSDRAFALDTEHATYDPAAVTRYWQVLSQVNLVLEEFAGRYSGKTSPVHHFWHTFDIALTRFADTVVEQPPTTDPVTREAYSREVVSSGFWFGDPSYRIPPSTPTRRRSRTASPTHRCRTERPGSTATAATSPCCPTSASVPNPIRARPSSTSTKPPTVPARPVRVGTSSGTRVPTASPIRMAVDRMSQERMRTVG
jgi:hypothetical protein